MKDLPRFGITLTLAVLAAAQTAAAPTKYALLVGCTRYDHLGREFHLEGPANDVLLMRDVLQKYYDLQERDIVILSEAAGKERGVQYRPTRANIEREFAELARKAKKGDKVVILLGGHGSQQPDSRPDDPERFEPDGKEEIFLPADCGEWDGISRVKNAIVDYEFRDWLKAIRRKDASVWVIVDACHSASMIRGTEVPREVPADTLVPKEVLQKAEEKAHKRQKERSRGPVKKVSTFRVPDEPDLAVIYAAQSTEPTVELILPEEGSERKPQGLLTYTLCKTLIEASRAKSPLTYQELLQRVHDQYKAWGRSYPTPLIEGKDRNHVVFGEEVSKDRAARSLIHLDQDRKGDWIIDAGSLSGLTVGSILKVFPPAGAVDANKLVGHVEILENGFGPLRARVQACEFDGLPEPKEKDLPKRGRCEIALVNYGNQRLAVAVDTRTFKGGDVPAERSRPLLDVLTKLAGEKGSLIEVAPSAAEAQWLLRFEEPASDKLYLLPATGWILPDSSVTPAAAAPKLPALFGPVPEGKQRITWLKDRLARIARVRNLLAIASRPARSKRESDLDTKCKFELLRFRNDADDTGVPVTRGPQGIVLYDEDNVRLQVTNQGSEPMDITILVIDSQYGITPIFPKSATVDGRVPPKNVRKFDRDIANTTVGLEHILVIAVRGKDVQEYARFDFLSQPSIEAATRAYKSGSLDKSLKSPLGQLLLKAAYGQGKSRGVVESSAKEFAFQLLSYTSAPEKRPAEKK
jgi:hypothetical protein